MKVKNYLRLNQLNVFYGSSQILFNLSFDAIRGKTLALLGRNGAGKSTTLKSLIGLVPISSGSYILNNIHLETLKSFEIAKLGVGYVPEDRQVFKLHTVEENLLIGAKENSKQKQTFHLKEIYNFFPLLNELKNRDAGLLLSLIHI